MSIEKTGAAQPLYTQTAQVSNTPRAAGGAGFSDVLKTAQSAATDLDSVFEAASIKYGVSVSLLKAVAKAESNFNPKAVSRCGAMGIMQLMPGTAAALGVTDPFDPEQNIMGGAKYLSQLLAKFDGDVKLAVAGYNAGPGNVVKYGGVPPFDETENYVTKVLGYLGMDITAGAVYTPAGTGGIGGADGNGSALGALLENALLSGMLKPDALDDLPGMLGALGVGLDGTNSLSEAAMAAVYQLQLRMLQGDEDDGKSFIV